MSSLSSSVLASSLSSTPSMRLISSCVLVLVWSRSSSSFLFFLAAPWQRSRCAISSCSSSRRDPIMLSIMVITLSKWPPAFAATAMRPRLALPKRAASDRSFWYALALRLWRVPPAAESCSSVVLALAKIVCASGLVRIFSASAMPTSSFVRSRERTDHSSDLTLQPCCVSSKKTSSAFSCALVSSRSVVVSASFFVLSASSLWCLSSVSCSVASSSFFVAMSSSYDFCFPASSPLPCSISPANASYMPFRMPWICVDCGA
mmetsp:Transcript_76986/g.198254  ORF Transcript_76986/g.198254 Transcript_76986/m.198254 type:complete len:261 (-) Transcript_76986:761-1543(-)